MKNVFLKLFWLDAILELLSPILFSNFPEIRYVTKPLLMILLMGHIAQENPKPALFITAIFALLGDVFLMLPGDSPLFFQLGLGAFLIMQVSYICLFAKQASEEAWIPAYARSPLAGALIYVFSFLAFLNPYLAGGMKIPVTLYAFALGSMLYFAIRLKNQTIVLGAFFFVVSDSVLAFGKFYYSFPGISTVVMSTYIVAQLLLISALCKLQLKK
ncbi:lysoplasmalogenase [Aquirufa lenticrescens]|uniref:lysoplasmalogenase n=1 Tax=Aquirufa lenticrescens TaxID=2696560 RepID=UPI001CAA4737|nr:lysoplasmalogenase [Aquirufa lenticrescens]UAJ14495.1 lysoplasmalogenase [Aquirufa lenticrescens]